MRKTLILLSTVILLFSFSGCKTYISSYKALGFVHSNNSDSASMSFWSFDGRMVFKLESKKEGDISYTAKLESGSATVYYDFYGKSQLFSIKGGEEFDTRNGYVEAGTVYIIVETDGKCKNGEFHFSLN